MYNLTIKAYYKALTTTKAYVIQSDVSTNFRVTIYNATNNLSDRILNDDMVNVIDTSNYYENLDIASNMMDTLTKQWAKDCYYYEWSEYLNRYDMTEYQFSKLKRILNQ
jgi:hypothetical protein